MVHQTMEPVRWAWSLMFGMSKTQWEPIVKDSLSVVVGESTVEYFRLSNELENTKFLLYLR